MWGVGCGVSGVENPRKSKSSSTRTASVQLAAAHEGRLISGGSTGEIIVFFNRGDVYHVSLDSGDLQYKPRN